MGKGGEVDGQRDTDRLIIQASYSPEIKAKTLQFANNSGFTSQLAVYQKDKAYSCVSRSEPGPKAEQRGCKFTPTFSFAI